MKNEMRRNLIYHTPIPVFDSINVSAMRESTQTTQLEAIARDGLTVSCNRETLDRLLPNNETVAPKQAVNMRVNFSLPGNTQAIKAECRVVCVRRLARDTFHLKMAFVDLAEKHFDSVSDYIEQSLESHRQTHQQVA